MEDEALVFRLASLRALGLTALVATTGVTTVAAHHSITGQYDLSRRLTLSGVIERVDWINPHAYVYLQVEQDDGSTESWALATVPLLMMRQAGLTREALAGNAGEVVTIDVLPGLEERRQGWILKISYPAGHFYQLSAR
jgi:hypothetical protein